MTKEIELSAKVPLEADGGRFDQVAALLFSEYSRSRLQQWIKSGELLVNGTQRKAKEKVFVDEEIHLQAELKSQERWQAQDIELDVIYSDDSVIVLNKQAGIVVHPAAGNPDGTVLNALLFRFPELDAIPRAGIVHRLDKDTSGLMVVARTLQAQKVLVEQLQARTVFRQYVAIARGNLVVGGTVDAPIGRHPRQRQKMAVIETPVVREADAEAYEARSRGAKEAITHYQLDANLNGYCLIRCRLETGRTHQIRVHMAHINHPLLGDPLYSGRSQWARGLTEEARDTIQAFGRQALHAEKLGLIHPKTGEEMEWYVDMPDDMADLLTLLEQQA